MAATANHCLAGVSCRRKRMSGIVEWRLPLASISFYRLHGVMVRWMILLQYIISARGRDFNMKVL
jgi:hypothetical protein